MSPARPLLGLVSIILIAGGVLLTLLTLLGGGIDKSPTNKFYFLQASTSPIPGAAATTRWTFWNACSVVDGKNSCPKVHAAYPLDPPRNFGTEEGVPQQFVGTHQYYYLTRFMFAFVLIGLFFGAISLILGLLALCSKIVSFLDSALVSVALFFQTLTAALMTAAYVKGRNNFHSANLSASLGKYNFGFMWATVACYFLATVLFCAGGAASGRSGKGSRGGGRRGRMGRFGRKKSSRSTRDRGSFINKETAVDGERSSFERGGRDV
ncbi:Eisosomes component [Lecanora helva]